MDILFPLLFAAVAYLVPKLGGKIWKEYQSKMANYGNFQRPTDKGETTVENVDMSTYVPSVIHQYELKAELESAPLPPPSPHLSENKAPWTDKMDGNAVIQGVIFAEIVQPPRAYRPFVKRK